jgi:hypothetical protein
MPDTVPLESEPFEEKSVSVIDWGRLIFTFIVLISLLGFLGLYFYFAVITTDKEAWTRIKDAFQVILPVVTGILGTVVAFYFGKPKG